MTHDGLWNEVKLSDEIKKLKKQLREAEGELSIIKGINFSSDKQKEINILKEQVKEAREINKLHQELNGKLREELELEKKNHEFTREDAQLKDMEIGRLMEKLNKKKS
jgi:predicted ABC-type transport system involved in lysophospholipase L1 biosynthesis ATPase subunit